jgi:uncharacterized protein YsxB (DUF464 family)
MASGLRFVAAGLFMIATAVFMGHAMGRHGDEMVTANVATVSAGFISIVMLVWGIVASIREQKKEGA